MSNDQFVIICCVVFEVVMRVKSMYRMKSWMETRKQKIWKWKTF